MPDTHKKAPDAYGTGGFFLQFVEQEAVKKHVIGVSFPPKETPIW